MEMDAVLLDAIIITTTIAAPFVEIPSSNPLKTVMVIARPHASTPTPAPLILSTDQPLPAMQPAVILKKRVVPITMVAVHRAAIASTTVSATRFAKIMW